MSILRRLAHQGLANFAVSMSGLCMMPLIVKTAGADVLGRFILMGSAFNLVTLMCTLGTGFTCRRYLAAAASAPERAKIFIPNASFQLVTHTISAVLLVIGFRMAKHFGFSAVNDLEPWLVILVVFGIYVVNLGDDFFRYTHQMRLVSTASILRSALTPTIAVGWIAVGQLSLNALFTIQAFVALLVGCYLWLAIAREFPLRFELSSWSQHRWDIRFGWPIMLAVLIELLLGVSDRYVLGASLSTSHVGAYGTACAIGGLILIVPKVVSAVLPAALSQAADGGRQADAEETLNRAIDIYCLLAVPFVAASALLGGDMLELLANPEVAHTARWVPAIAALTSSLYGYNWLVFSSLFVQMDTYVWFRANLLAAVLAITLSIGLLTLVPRVESVALAMLLSYGASTWMLERSRDRRWRIRWSMLNVSKAVVAAGVMAAAIFSTKWILDTDVPRTALMLVPIGVLSYGTALWALGALPIRELKHVIMRIRGRTA